MYKFAQIIRIRSRIRTGSPWMRIRQNYADRIQIHNTTEVCASWDLHPLLFSPSNSPPSHPSIPFVLPPQTPHPPHHLWMGPEISCLLTIILSMYLLFIWGWTYGFGWGKSISWRGGPWNLHFFWAQMALRSFPFQGPKKSRFQGPKSLDFRAHHFKRPSLWITPPSKSIRHAPYKQQVH